MKNKNEMPIKTFLNQLDAELEKCCVAPVKRLASGKVGNFTVEHWVINGRSILIQDYNEDGFCVFHQEKTNSWKGAIEEVLTSCGICSEDKGTQSQLLTKGGK